MLQPINGVSYFAFTDPQGRGGVVVACGDVDNDGNDEILTTRGPIEENNPRLNCWNYDGDELTFFASKSFMLFETDQFVAGANVALGNFYEQPDYLP